MVSRIEGSKVDGVDGTLANPSTRYSRWAEEFEAVIIANGHYTVPFVRPPTLQSSNLIIDCCTGTTGQWPPSIYPEIQESG
jgi:hypothetical protein